MAKSIKKVLPKAQVGKPVKKSTTPSGPTPTTPKPGVPKPNYKSLTKENLGRVPTASDSTEYRKGWERGARDNEINSPVPQGKIQWMGINDNWKLRGNDPRKKKGGAVKSKKK